ncbi:MAG: glutamate racemase, partial [FCB group bacterium]|nr:glutamate racemase [FCB group bacterium]
MMQDKPIGVFDSGVGGLTVVSEILKQLPGEQVVYFGDVGRTPYGPRSKDIIIQFTRQDVAFLREQDVKFIICACNSATAAALETVAGENDIDMLGVIEPGARAGAATTRNGKVGIIGTQATVASNAYAKAIHHIDEKIKVFSLACPLFVPLAEEGYLDREATYLIAGDYLKGLKENDIDTLVLGCTHYPLMKQTIQDVIGDDVTLIDSATATTREVKKYLEEHGLKNRDGKATDHKFFVSDVPDKFA